MWSFKRLMTVGQQQWCLFDVCSRMNNFCLDMRELQSQEVSFQDAWISINHFRSSWDSFSMGTLASTTKGLKKAKPGKCTLLGICFSQCVWQYQEFSQVSTLPYLLTQGLKGFSHLFLLLTLGLHPLWTLIDQLSPQSPMLSLRFLQCHKNWGFCNQWHRPEFTP